MRRCFTTSAGFANGCDSGRAARPGRGRALSRKLGAQFLANLVDVALGNRQRW